MNTGRRLRLRAVLDPWFGVVVLGVVILAAAGGFVTHGAYVDPGTHQEQRVVDEWAVDGSFSHQAVVRGAGNEIPFESGETVQNREVYFRTIMPVLEGEFVVAARGTQSPVNFTIDRRLVVENVEQTTGDQEPTVYWRDSRRLGNNRTTVQPGGTASVPFRLNVTRTLSRAENVSQRLASPGETQIRIVVDVVATRGTDDAQRRTLTFAMPVTGDVGVYRVQPESDTQTYTEREVVTVPNEPGQLQRVGGPLALAVGLLGLVGLAYARWRDAVSLSAAEREWLAYRADRAEFDEWLTAIRLPEEARDLPVARAESLGDLVDYAIDTDSAVVDDPDSRAYHVVHDGYRYTFEAPPEPGGADPLGSAAATAGVSGPAEDADGATDDEVDDRDADEDGVTGTDDTTERDGNRD